MNQETIAKLRAPFPLEAHTCNYEGFIYADETAVTERLDEVDPAWAFEIISIVSRDKKVSVHARLTVCGVSRDGVGMQGIEYVKDKKTGEITDFEVSEVEKGAATDALRRCARMFGIGRYLLSAAKIQKDAPKTWQNVPAWKPFTDWYAREFRSNTPTPTAPPKNANKPAGSGANGTPEAPPAEIYIDNPDGSITVLKRLTQADVVTLQTKWNAEGLSNAEIMTALGVSRASLFEGDYADADKRVEEFHKTKEIAF